MLLNAKVAELVEEILFCGDSQNGGSQSQSQARYQEIGPPDWRAHQLMMPGHYMISCFDRSIYNIYVGEYIVPNPLYWYPGEEERGSPAADARTHDKPPTQRHTTL